MSELTLEMWMDDMKPILIDQIQPGVTCVTYPDGEKRWVYDTMTIEDLDNLQRQDEFIRRWLDNNRKKLP